eukprot:TRINITY_DN5504_c0_g1_i1.p1 TRINITY_DN5504_c0_g1~~TRINITY_DN5504_c0_g1_i1.p1  ORF type:complete len:318 (+),score=70.62 TRINITY_DN5504_c0_g1_i1:87-1040(+)
MLDLGVLIEQVRNGRRLERAELLWVCTRTKALLVEESNVQSVPAPVTIVGDIHGQYPDLLELFRVGGWPPDTNYLFLGDYVDRGRYSVETISLLLCLKLRWPLRVTLLRGNHESRGTSMVYGFYQECLNKYGGDSGVWSAVMDVFDCMTISAVVEDSIFAVHGGLSPSVEELDQLRIINRFQDVPRDGPFADIMWSDPEADSEGFSSSVRGAGYGFGKDIVLRFLYTNRLQSVARAHQLCADGYQLHFGGLVCTVWSAPNYCYRCGNLAAILEVDEDLLAAGGRPQPSHFNVFGEAPDNCPPEDDDVVFGAVVGYFN